MSGAVAEDLTALQDVNEASILHTLRQRYNKDLIYTSIGPVLIAVNPVRPRHALSQPRDPRRRWRPLER